MPRNLRLLVVPALTGVCGALLLPAAKLTAEPSPPRAQTPDNYATGAVGSWDFGGTDLTFKRALGEVWVLDAHTDSLPFVNAFKVSDLASPPVRRTLTLPDELSGAVVLGIAEIPNGAYAGKNLILADRTFGVDGSVPDPQFLILDDEGKPVPDFPPLPPVGLKDGARISSIDVNPEREEIAAYDLVNDEVYVLDATFVALGTPFRVLGEPNLLSGVWYLNGDLRGSGVGIAYDGPDTLIADAAFRNLMDTRFALEYDLAAGGVYTGRAMDMSGASAVLGSPDLVFMGLAEADVGGGPSVAALNMANDALYLFDLTLDDHPPPPSIVSCGTDAETGGYALSWNLDPAFEADSIRIIENGVAVATLPPTATDYVSTLPLLGKAFIEVAVEKGGAVSGLRAICELENTDVPPLEGVQFAATQFDPSNGIRGIAVTKTPATPADFRAYVLRANSNRVTGLDYKLSVVEEIQLDLP